MHKICHVATFNYVTCHNIKPFKMNNHNENKLLNFFVEKCTNYAMWQKLMWQCGSISNHP